MLHNTTFTKLSGKKKEYLQKKKNIKIWILYSLLKRKNICKKDKRISDKKKRISVKKISEYLIMTGISAKRWNQYLIKKKRISEKNKEYQNMNFVLFTKKKEYLQKR